MKRNIDKKQTNIFKNLNIFIINSFFLLIQYLQALLDIKRIITPHLHNLRDLQFARALRY